MEYFVCELLGADVQVPCRAARAFQHSAPFPHDLVAISEKRFCDMLGEPHALEYKQGPTVHIKKTQHYRQTFPAIALVHSSTLQDRIL